MLTADTDYQRVALLLSKQQLAPYVSYQRTDKVNGVIKHRDPARTVIRISDGKIISGGDDSIDVETGNYHAKSNPVSHPAFDPSCYRPTAEMQINYNGTPAVKFDLAPTCKSPSPDDDEYPFTTLCASADSLQPLDVRGTVRPNSDSKDVTVNIDQAYGNYEGRVLPSRLKVDVSGSGWMLWLQIHVTETYNEYAFTDKP